MPELKENTVEVRPLHTDGSIKTLIDGGRKEGDDDFDLPKVFVRRFDGFKPHGDPFNITRNGLEDRLLEFRRRE